MHPDTQATSPVTVNALIVGQGLAGSLVCWELHRNGQSVAVVDEPLPVTSSKIAAGMFNAINTKRGSVMPNAERMLDEAIEMYRSMETELGIQIVNLKNIYNVFGNVKESNDLSLKADHPFFQAHTNYDPTPEPHVIQPYGAFEVSKTGWIDMKQMLAGIRKFVADTYTLREEHFDYPALRHVNNRWEYRNISAERIVFCEGYRARQNPFFTDINIIPCKGDVLEFEAPGLHPSRVIKKGIYIVPLGDGKFKAGSLYKWENEDETPHAADRIELEQKISSLIDMPFTVTAHHTAIRPTTKTRDTIVVPHPELPEMFLLNGLGTKGVVNGVKVVKAFMKMLRLK
jgi:glycine oxidase